MRLLRPAVETIVALVIALTFGASAWAAPVTASFEPDFTQSDSVDDFIETNSANWTLNTGAGVYNALTNLPDNPVSAAVQVTNLPTGANFLMSTQFTLNAIAGPDTTIGFGALSADSNMTDGSGGYYLADVSRSGRIRILELNGGGAGVIDYDAIDDLTTGTLYTLTLTGVYISGNLKLTLQVTDGVQSASVSLTDSASIQGGQYFGLRNRSQGLGSNFDVDFSQFSIAAPSPAALPAGLGLLTLLAMRRRHSQV